MNHLIVHETIFKFNMSLLLAETVFKYIFLVMHFMYLLSHMVVCCAAQGNWACAHNFMPVCSSVISCFAGAGISDGDYAPELK